MILSEQILQIFLWTIVVLSALIAYEFYRSKDGRLRLLIIELFLTKMWVYGGGAIYYLLMDYGYMTSIEPGFVRIALNLPMLFVMLKLWGFIRMKDR